MKELYNIYKRCERICTDTRNIIPGSLFFALKGDNFDANEMIEKAFDGGAAHVVTSNGKWQDNPNATVVDDTLATLQQLASFHRSHIDIPIIGITGTNGKTTTKELVNAVLSSHYNCYATVGNLNNHIGVPLSVLSIGSHHQTAVIEMGANHPGEIAFLCSIAKPTHGLVTNVGKAHLEGFGSFEGVKRTKGELYQFLKTHNGKVFINKGNNHLLEMLGNYTGTFTYCTGSEADISGCESVGSTDFLELEWHHKGETNHKLKTRLLGGYNLENVLAAVAVGVFFNIPADKINNAVETYTPSNNRSQKIDTGRNTIFLDAYNANPSSLSLAIKNFGKAAGDSKMLIVGGMKELGTDSPSEHKAIAELISDLGFGDVMLVGTEFGALSKEYGQFNYFETTAEVCEYLAKTNIAGKTILVKGSRSNQLEKIVPYL